jgi:hypothetical protein
VSSREDVFITTDGEMRESQQLKWRGCVFISPAAFPVLSSLGSCHHIGTLDTGSWVPPQILWLHWFAEWPGCWDF